MELLSLLRGPTYTFFNSLGELTCALLMTLSMIAFKRGTTAAGYFVHGYFARTLGLMFATMISVCNGLALGFPTLVYPLRAQEQVLMHDTRALSAFVAFVCLNVMHEDVPAWLWVGLATALVWVLGCYKAVGSILQHSASLE